MGRQSPTHLIGWREWVGLPDLGVDLMKAKIDTGARTSAMHAWDVEPVDVNGETHVSFALHPMQHSDDEVVRCDAPLLEWREIRSSNGETEERPVVLTRLVACGLTYEVELTLTRRDEMGFRMLLGRNALKTRFLVDPGRSYIGGRPDKAGK